MDPIIIEGNVVELTSPYQNTGWGNTLVKQVLEYGIPINQGTEEESLMSQRIAVVASQQLPFGRKVRITFEVLPLEEGS